MNAEAFVAALTAARPNPEELEEYGLDADEVAGILRVFDCPRVAQPGVATGSAVLDLLQNYSCASVEVSQFRFVGSPNRTPVGTQIGWWEADPVVLEPGGKVIALDRDSRLLCPCADSSEQLLDALALILGATADKPQWRGRAAELAQQCAAAAGVASDPRFYAALCAFLG